MEWIVKIIDDNSLKKINLLLKGLKYILLFSMVLEQLDHKFGAIRYEDLLNGEKLLSLFRQGILIMFVKYSMLGVLFYIILKFEILVLSGALSIRYIIYGNLKMISKKKLQQLSLIEIRDKFGYYVEMVKKDGKKETQKFWKSNSRLADTISNTAIIAQFLLIYSLVKNVDIFRSSYLFLCLIFVNILPSITNFIMQHPKRNYEYFSEILHDRSEEKKSV